MSDFKWIVQSGNIVNNGVSLQDIEIAQQIWGNTLSVAAIKGKTTKTDPPPVVADFVKVPQVILDANQDVTLSADVFFVNKIPFLLTISRHLAFTTVSHLEDQKMSTIFKHFRDVYRLYKNRGFKIILLLVDGEFAALQTLVHDMEHGPRVNLTSANEHVPEAEWRIRVVKERVRASRHDLPFTRLPKLLTIHMVLDCVKMLNYFPTKGGLSVSPRLLMTGVGLDSKKHFRVPFGHYCQVHEDDKPRNSMLPRTSGAICLGHSGNLQGGHKFLCLNSGRLIVRYKWTPLPMPEVVLARVTLLGAEQPENLIFADRRGRTLGEIELPGVYVDPFNEEPTDNEDETNDFELNEAHTDVPTKEAESTVEMDLPTEDSAILTDLPTEEEMPTTTTGLPDPGMPTGGTVEIAGVPTEEPRESLRRSTRIKFKPSTYTPSLKGKAYVATQQEILLHPNSHLESSIFQDYVEPSIMALIMTQLSMKKGLRSWGNAAKKAIHKEVKQMHLRDTFKPMRFHELTDEQKAQILESHLFLTKKRVDGDIKGRLVAGGDKQRDFVTKEDSSSPTATTESVILTCIIDAEERRDVAVVDIPNAFIQTKIEKESEMAIIRLRGQIVEELMVIAPEVYGPYTTKDKRGDSCLIVQCKNAIYGTMVASLLYYRKFRASLESIGFEFNPYDPCVANKMINGRQMTICFHVDDCKTSHVESTAVGKMIEWLKEHYETVWEDELEK